jgi:flagellar hook assembly protein FlgD
VALAVYDPAGRRVRQLVSGREPAGEHAVVWDLRDERGGPVGAGVYFARLESGGQALIQKVMRVK